MNIKIRSRCLREKMNEKRVKLLIEYHRLIKREMTTAAFWVVFILVLYVFRYIS